MSPLVLLLALLFLGIGAIAFAVIQQMRGGGVEARLAQYTGGEATGPAPDLRARINEAVVRTNRGSNIARDLARADLRLTAGEFVILKIVSAIATAVLVAWLSSRVAGAGSLPVLLGGGIFGAVIGSFFPNLYVGFRARRRIRAFNNQLADTIGMLSSSIRSGYSLLQSMDLVARESTPPVATEFRRVVQETGLGLSTDAALANLLRRVPSDDLDLMITAVNIQQEVGGNLAQILESIAHTIRERVRIKGEIRTLTSQGRMSGYVITAMPVFLAVMLSLINPGYMAPIFTFGLPPRAWCCLPLTGAVMITMGYFAIMKIVNIDV